MEPITQELINKWRANPNGQDWYIISNDYILTKSFIQEFKDRINWVLYMNNPHVILSTIYTNRQIIFKNYVQNYYMKQSYNNCILRYYSKKVAKRIFKDKLPIECIKMITQYL